MTLAERRCFHTAVQVFKVLYQPAVSCSSQCPARVFSKKTGLCLLRHIQDTVVELNKCRLFIPQINTSIDKSGFFLSWSCDFGIAGVAGMRVSPGIVCPEHVSLGMRVSPHIY